MKGYFIVFILFGLWSGSGLLNAQNKISTKSKKAIDAYNSGLRQYSLHNFPEAEVAFLNAVAADSLFIEAYLLLAEVYEDTEQPLKAIQAYKKGLALDAAYYPYGFIKQGNLAYREGLYETANACYEQYLALNTGNISNNLKAKEGLARCRFSMEAKKHPVDFKPVNLGPHVNSSHDDYWPSLSADEQTLVITRLIDSDDPFRKVQEDFFISHRISEGWSEMNNAGPPLNTGDNEGAQALSGDGRYMVFTACNRSDGLGRCDLYYSVRVGNDWSVPKNLGKPVNTTYRETQPSLGADGRTLYFSSDRPGGKGLHDIWMSRRDESGQWSVPENLGDRVNTTGIEMSPFIHPDNMSLYFSSDGLLGLGGYDLFVSRCDSSGIWQEPVNLGYPINTNRDEIGLIVNAHGDKAYYASDIEKERGKDIFVFDLPVKSRPLMVTYMKGRVFDGTDNHSLRAHFELINLKTGQVIHRSYSDSITGEFLVSIPTNQNYMLNVSRSGYLFYSENFSLKGNYEADKPYLKDVPMQPILIGNSIILKNVFYEADSYSLKKESESELNKVVKFMQANPLIRIEISGHTDNTGKLEHNVILSGNRAETVAAYLIAQGIQASRIVTRGYGLSRPVADNDTEEGKAQNRRTELKIIE